MSELTEAAEEHEKEEDRVTELAVIVRELMHSGCP